MTITLPPPLGTFAAIFAGASTGGLIVINGVAPVGELRFPACVAIVRVTDMHFNRDVFPVIRIR